MEYKNLKLKTEYWLVTDDGVIQSVLRAKRNNICYFSIKYGSSILTLKTTSKFIFENELDAIHFFISEYEESREINKIIYDVAKIDILQKNDNIFIKSTGIPKYIDERFPYIQFYYFEEHDDVIKNTYKRLNELVVS